MHEELRVYIDIENYHKAFRDWRLINNKKLSTEFDKQIGIGAWKKVQITEHIKKYTVKVKNKEKYLIAILKYGL
jgi:hypothetical protein